jgi:ABC-type amino acid transport substrate-binding protein
MKFWKRPFLSLLVTAMLVGTWLPAAAQTPSDATPAPAPVAVPEPAPATSPDTPLDDWSKVKAAGKLVVGTAADYPPFEFYNSNFELDGFDIALMKELGRRLGVEVVFNDFAFGGLLNALRLGQVDAAIGAISVTPDRQEVVDFTNLYYIGEDAALVRADNLFPVNAATDLAGKKVGVEAGTTYQQWVQRNAVDKGVISQENLVPYDNLNGLLRDLRNGNIDVALLGLLPAEQATMIFKDLQVAGSKFNRQQFAVAARKGSSLVEELNQALVDTQVDGTFSKLVTQYLLVSPGEVTPAQDDAQVENLPPPTATPEVAPTEAAKQPEQPVVPPLCIDGMKFVEDLNFDDHNMTAPPVMGLGQDFAKGWRIQNSGTCTWEPGFEMVYVNGNRAEATMSGSPAAVGRAVAPGETVDVYVNLRAPQSYGTFQGFWQMRNLNGQYFGEVVWVGIQVPDPNPPPPPPPPPADVNPNLRADNSWVNPGQCTVLRWDVDGVSAVYLIENGNQRGVGGHDALTVCPWNTTTYVLRVVRADGVPVDFPITVNVGGGGNAPYSITFWTDRDRINRGECTTLRWDVQGVREVYLNDEGVPGVSARDVCPSESKTYYLRVVRHDGGQETREQRIHVEQGGGGGGGGGPRIDRWTVDRNEISAGKCVELKWRGSDIGKIRIYRNGEQVHESSAGEGKHKDCPPGPGLYEYRLHASGHTGETDQTLTVTVTG